MNYEELKKQVAVDLELTPDTAEIKSLKLSSIYIHYLDIYMGEVRKLKDLQANKEKQYTLLLHKFRKEGFEKFEVKGKDVDHYIHLDVDYQKIVSEFKEQTFITNYLESVLEQINKLSFNIKNFIDIQKVKLGIN